MIVPSWSHFPAERHRTPIYKFQGNGRAFDRKYSLSNHQQLTSSTRLGSVQEEEDRSQNYVLCRSRRDDAQEV